MLAAANLLTQTKRGVLRSTSQSCRSCCGGPRSLRRRQRSNGPAAVIDRKTRRQLMLRLVPSKSRYGFQLLGRERGSGGEPNPLL